MYLLIPANSKQLIERAKWFKNPVARGLEQSKNIEFGYELKGKPETITTAPPLFWGYHLPGEFASEWYYHSERRSEMLKSLSGIASLKPDYINLHGIHLWWKPPSSEHIHRYINHSKPEELLKILDGTCEIVTELKKSFKIVTLENYPPCGLYWKVGQFIPETYLYTGSGRLSDLLYLKEKTGIEILLDLEHLILTLNFLNREKNYRNIPINKTTNPSSKEKQLGDIFGFYLPEDGYPYVNKKIELSDVIKKIEAKYYHLTGSSQDVEPGVKDLTHQPIAKTNRGFINNLRLILAQNPTSLLVETANSSDDPLFNHLRPNETELSFYALCEILLKEL